MRRSAFTTDIWAHACFDPLTLTAAAIGSSVIGAGASIAGGVAGQQGASIAAQGTIAGGNAALQAAQMQKQAADYQAGQLTENAAQSFAAGQRQMLGAQENTRLAISTARANAAGNGTNAGVGSAATIQGALAKRGSYNAAMDMFNGASTATGLINQAKGVRYSGDADLIGGEEQQQAARIQAQATLAGGSASLLSGAGGAFSNLGGAFKSYGNYAFPTIRSA